MSGVFRVLLVTGEYPPDEGGVADYTRCLAEALAERGMAVDVVTGRRRKGSAGTAQRAPTKSDLSALDNRVSPAPDNHIGTKPQPTEYQPHVSAHRVIRYWGWSSLRALRPVIKTLRPDVVHVQYQTAAFEMHPAIPMGLGRLGRRTNTRTAITYHDLREPYLFPKAGRVRGWVTRHPAKSMDLAITTNPADHAALQAWGHARRLALVPIGANVPDAPPEGWTRDGWRDSAGVPRDADLLVYFGFLNPSKGGRTLLAALGRLVADGRDARLVMLGGTVGASDATNAAELGAFEGEVAAAGLKDRIIWTGHVPSAEVSAWLRAADVAVLPYADGASYRRGSLLAALEHGCAVVTTWPGGVPSAVSDAGGDSSVAAASDSDTPPPLSDGESARMVRPGDAEALTAAVAEVLDDPELSTRLSAGARELAGHFGWKGIARRHEGMYRRLIASE